MDFLTNILSSDTVVSGSIFMATRAYIYSMVRNFGIDGFGRLQQLVIACGVVYLTLWYMAHGWRLATGRSRDSMMEFTSKAILAGFVMFLAQAALSNAANIIDLIDHFQGIISTAIAGDTYNNPERMIDATMVLMQLLAERLEGQITGEGGKEMQTTALVFITGMGQGLPALVSGGLLLLNKIALYLCVLFAPLALVLYIFEKSRFVFVNWAKFTITTLFSLGVITAVIMIAMKAVLFVSATFLIADQFGGLDLKSIATVQGGLGMLMTTLILGTPPLITNFFSGQVSAAFNGYNQIGANAAGKPAAGPQDLMQRTANAGNSGAASSTGDTSTNTSDGGGNLGKLVGGGAQDSQNYANEGGIKTASQAQHGVAANAATSHGLGQDVQRANSQVASANSAQGSTGSSSGSAYGSSSQSAAQTNAAEERALAGYKQNSGAGNAGSNTSTSSYNASSASNNGSSSTAATSSAAATSTSPSNPGPVDVRHTGPGADSEAINRVRGSRGVNSPTRNA